MSKQLYEEAIADVRKIKEVAELNAQKAIIDAVAPRIRQLIESELLGIGRIDESSEDDLEDLEEKKDDGKADNQLMFDEKESTDKEVEPKLVTVELDDSEPKIDTSKVDLESVVDNSESKINLDDLGVQEKEEIEVAAESVIRATNKIIASKNLNASSITSMKKNVFDVYSYLQESNCNAKLQLSEQLEKVYDLLSKTQENVVMPKKRINEGDITLKLTGLPNDVDLDSIGIDLMGQDETEEEVEETEEVADEESKESQEETEETSEEDSEVESEEETEEVSEADLQDDDVVEIDEGMLRREIHRLKKLREAMAACEGEECQVAEGDEDDLDIDVDNLDDEVKSSKNEQKELEEIEELMSDEELEEQDDVVQIGDKRTRSQLGGSATSVPSKDKSNPADRVKESKDFVKNRLNNASQKRVAATPKTSRNRLSEANLSNAKLILKSKVDQIGGISSVAKQKISRLIESASSIESAKKVYIAAVEATKRSTIAESREILGSSSRVTKSASTVHLNEGVSTDRWAKLAGIIK